VALPCDGLSAAQNPAAAAVVVAAGVALGEACTIVLRGASSHILEEADRSLHDALCVLSETVKEPRVLYGGGWPEMRMARAIEEAAKKTPGWERSSCIACLPECVVLGSHCTWHVADDDESASELSSDMVKCIRSCCGCLASGWLFCVDSTLATTDSMIAACMAMHPSPYANNVGRASVRNNKKQLAALL